MFWVDMDNPTTAKRDFIAVAKLLGRSAETVPEALQVLATTERSWLLILDNADDPDFDYQVYFPPGYRGAVLMTSRIAECRRYSPDAFEALEGLKGEDSRHLLLKAAEAPQESWPTYDSQAKEVVALLGSHTLALIQAGAYVSQGHCQLDQYSKIYQKQQQQLLKYQPTQAQSRYRDVYATFEASADFLEQSQTESASDALRLLEILSMLSSSILPFRIFEEAWMGCKEISQDIDKARGIDEFSRNHVLQLPSFMVQEEDKWNPFRLTKARALLASLSLVTQHDLDNGVGLSMHPLTHAWAKDRQDSERQGVAWIAAGCVLGFSRSTTRMWQEQERGLLPHILSYLDMGVGRAFGFALEAIVTPIILKCGSALLDMRQDSKLSELLQYTFLELGETPTEPSEKFLPLYNLQARSLIDLGKTEAARLLLAQVLEILEEILGKTHPDTLATMSCLALVLHRRGKYADAEAMNRQTLEISEKVLGKTHPDTLASMSNLAVVLESQGKYAEAEAMNRETLENSEKVLGKTHPHTLLSMNNLATVLMRQGKYVYAEAMNRQTLEIREEVLGKTHDDTLRSVYCLADLLQKTEEYEEASTLYQRACTGFKLSLGSEHPTTKACMNHYSIMLNSLERTR